MTDSDRAAAMLTSMMLRASDRTIEAMALETIVDDPMITDLESAIVDASQSDVKAGAFGMEVVGVLVVPVLIEAAKQFWSAYSKKLMEKAGEELAGWTVSKFKNWFLQTETNERSEVRDGLIQKVRSVGSERGMSAADIDALVVAMTPDRLSEALAAT